MAKSFDESELLERVDNDREFLAETVAMLAGDGRTLMDDVRRLAHEGDAPGIGRVAHSLKGMISNFCAAEAHQSAHAVERLGKSGDLSTSAPAIQELSERLESLISDLEQFLRNPA